MTAFAATAEGFRVATFARQNNFVVPDDILYSSLDYKSLLPALARCFDVPDADCLETMLDTDQDWDVIPLEYLGFDAILLGIDGHSLNNHQREDDVDLIGTIRGVPYVRFCGANTSEFIAEFRKAAQILAKAGVVPPPRVDPMDMI